MIPVNLWIAKPRRGNSMRLTIETPIHFKRVKAGRKMVAVGRAQEPQLAPPDPIPRISRLMAPEVHLISRSLSEREKT